MDVTSKLPRVGTTIFSVMSQLAAEHKAINLGQGFPDFPVPPFLVEALQRAMREGHNQYAPMTGIPALRQQVARQIHALYGCSVDADAEVTVTSGATEAIFAAVHALVRHSLQDILSADGFQVAVAENGAQALKLAREIRFDVVLCLGILYHLPEARSGRFARGLATLMLLVAALAGVAARTAIASAPALTEALRYSERRDLSMSGRPF